jgi:hypothetical protein
VQLVLHEQFNAYDRGLRPAFRVSRRRDGGIPASLLSDRDRDRDRTAGIVQELLSRGQSVPGNWSKGADLGLSASCLEVVLGIRPDIFKVEGPFESRNFPSPACGPLPYNVNGNISWAFDPAGRAEGSINLGDLMFGSKCGSRPLPSEISEP